MENLNINTAQNVTINQNLASLGERMLATLIDGAFLVIYYLLVFGLIFGTDAELPDWTFVLLGLPVFLYHFIMELAFSGQSMGKMLLKLRVVRLDGGAPGLMSYLTRWLLRIVEVQLFMGIPAMLVILANGKGQRVGDIVAKTTVIREKRQAMLSETIFMHLPPGYRPLYEQARLLEDEHARLIREVLQAAREASSAQLAQELAESLARKLEDLLAMSRTPTQRRPVDFLETLLRDYNYFHQQ